MKNMSYLSYILIAPFALGVFSDQANSQKMSEQEIAKRAPDFRHGNSLYKYLNTEPRTFQTEKSFEEMQLCLVSASPYLSPRSFTYNENEKYMLWIEDIQLLLRYTQINLRKQVELYSLNNFKNSWMIKNSKTFFNRIEICTGNVSIESDN
jgi:hypothetical protein